jgi:hypothetical protein
MQSEKKYFVSSDSFLDSDSADFAVPKNAWVNMENFRTGTTDIGVIGTVESIGSTSLIIEQDPEFIAIGSSFDEENQRFVTFYYSSLGNHKIECCYADTGVVYTVLESADVIGGLNFTKEPIHSSAIIGNLLSWVDGTNNQPRRINIESGIKAYQGFFQTDAQPYSLPLNFSEITLIKRPPTFSPNISKKIDNSFSGNFIANQSFEFAYQYVYYDGEVSVVGAYSQSTRLNFISELFNYVQVLMDLSEIIPNTVKIVNLIARIQDGTNPGGLDAFIVKQWNKERSSDAAAINSHNEPNIFGQRTPLPFNFYNNSLGEKIATDDTLRPFDNVPIYSKTMEIAKYRQFLANNTEGYDTPLTTSLSGQFTTIAINTTPQSVPLYGFSAYNAFTIPLPGYFAYYIYTSINNQTGYFLISTSEYSSASGVPNPIPTAPTSVAGSNLIYIGSQISELLARANQYLVAQYGAYAGGCNVSNLSLWTPSTTSLTGQLISNSNIFPQRSQYKIGIVFYDYAMRKCGVVESPSLLSTKYRNFNYGGSWENSGIVYYNPANGLSWSVNNTNAVNEIPDWAYYYSVVRTLNLRTRFFVQGISDVGQTKYAEKDPNGVYVFTNTIYSTNTVGIAISTRFLVQSNLGYVYSEGDYCILTTNVSIPAGQQSLFWELPVIGQQGEYVILKPQNIGNLSTANAFIYELYTPYVVSDEEPYYEVGEIYAVNNPGQSNREYSVTTNTLLPDTYLINRNITGGTNSSYLGNAMCPNDNFFKRWDTDAGKTNFITNIGQVKNITSISWSDTITTGTRVNGTSTFRLGNRAFVPDESGEINKLIFTSKVQESGQGMIMLAISSHETNSCYLGETQILDNTGATQFFSGSTNVIGTINTLKGSLGTTNPEAVVEFRGQVYYPDAYKGVWVQYSTNGLFPISNYKTTRFWKSFFKQYLSMTKEEIEALGSRPYIFTAVDNAHLELLISIPKLTDLPIKTVPDYDFAYPFDMWDGQGKTIVFCLEGLHPQAHWQGSYSFNPELFTTVGNRLYSNKNGSLWIHNVTDEYNRFYDNVYPSRIMFVSNEVPTKMKVYNNITVQANMKPSFTYLYNDFPYLQTSDLLESDYREFEGIYYSPIYRNKIVPTNTGYTTDGLLTFEKMRNTAMKIMLEFNLSKNNYTPAELKFVDIGYDISNGHTT